jgi:hypothetical protein
MNNTEHWESLATGRSGAIDLERAWLRKAKEVFEIFCDKQRGYGPNNIAQGGASGVVMRNNDKWKRMFQLTFKHPGEEPLEDENLRDTAIDLADYFIIWLMVHDGDGPAYEEDFLEPILEHMAKGEWSEAIGLLMEQYAKDQANKEAAELEQLNKDLSNYDWGEAPLEEYNYAADDLAFDAAREKEFFG